MLFISAHFPPDFSAGAHRARLLAPHLAAAGWTPTVLTVTPESYEARLDPQLAGSVPASLDLVRVEAWPVRGTRALGVGDLGLRALLPLRRACAQLCARQRYDLVYITIYPTYPAVLGPWLKRRWNMRFVLDLQDPWVGSWGERTGPGGVPDMKSRVSRALALRLERTVVPSTDGVTAVSAGTICELAARVPHVGLLPTEELPIGWEPRDLAQLGDTATRADGPWTAVYAGTVLPAGRDIVRAFFRGLAAWRRAQPGRAAGRMVFVGSSNESAGSPAPSATPIAAEEGVSDLVDERPARVPYFEALGLTAGADLVLVLGTTEPHYTASKVFPALLSRRPVLAVVHRSSAVAVLLKAHPTAGIELVEVGDVIDIDCLSNEIARRLTRLAALGRGADVAFPAAALEPSRADVLAERLARLFRPRLRGWEGRMTPIRLTVVMTHPVQYFSPWARHIAATCPDIDLTVVYAVEPTPTQQGTGFGRAFVWDVPLREGYRSVVCRAPRPADSLAADDFFGLDVPDIGRTLEATRPDLLLAPGWNSRVLVRAIRWARTNGIPLLYRGDSHLHSSSPGLRRRLSHVRARWLLRQFDAGLAVGQRSAEYLAAMGVARDAIFRSPHCVDNDFFAAAVGPYRVAGARELSRRELGLAADRFVVAFVGKLAAYKRPLDAIRAIGVAAIFRRARGRGVRAYGSGLSGRGAAD